MFMEASWKIVHITFKKSQCTVGLLNHTEHMIKLQCNYACTVGAKILTICQLFLNSSKVLERLN